VATARRPSKRRRDGHGNAQAGDVAAAARSGRRGGGASRGAVESAVMSLPLAKELRWWAESVMGVASTAADLSMNVARLTLRRPAQRAALERAGAMLRGFREAAGMSLRDVGAAIDLGDPALLEAAEGGRIGLPFEIILRLAAVLGRNDPVSFVMKLTRAQNPSLWKTLERLGVGRLVVQVGREREFANVYRANNEVRRLTDAEFAEVLAFVQAAFDMAMSLHRKRRQREAAASPSTD